MGGTQPFPVQMKQVEIGRMNSVELLARGDLSLLGWKKCINQAGWYNFVQVLLFVIRNTDMKHTGLKFKIYGSTFLQ